MPNDLLTAVSAADADVDADFGFGFDSQRRQPDAARAWPFSRFVLIAGLVLAGAMLAALVTLVTHDRQSAIDAQLERNSLYARLLQEQAARSIDAVSVSLAHLGATLAAQGLDSAAWTSVELEQMLASLPQLRGVAALDLSGRVLVSNVADDIGRRVDLKRFGALPGAGREGIGPYVAGRGLSDLAADRAAGSAVSSDGFMPLLRHAHVRVFGVDTELLLVALISGEGLANQMRLTISDASSRALLVGFDAGLYADTDTEPDLDTANVCATASAAVCQKLAVHPALHNYLPAIESASFVGAGVIPGEQTVAFRALRAWPLLVLVERPLANVTTEWGQTHHLRVVLTGLAVLAVVALTFVAARSLRGREKVRGDLDLAHAKVARSAREIAVIVRSVQQLLFRTDAHGTLTFINAHGALAGGGLFEHVLGKRFDALVKPDEREIVHKLFSRDGSVAVRNATVTIGARHDGPAERHRERRFDVAVVALYDGRRVAGFAGSAVDITEREDAQARLAEQLAFSALLLEISPLPTARIDRKGRYLSVNLAWQESTGLTREQLLGTVLGSTLWTDAGHHRAAGRNLLATGGQLRYETVFTHVDGLPRYVVVHLVAVPGRDGVPQGVLCTFMDMTEQRVATLATQAARAAAEESSRAKSEFIANISHELRTPLQAIIGFSELGTLPGRSRELHAAMFTDILNAGHRMLALVNDLLDVAKIQSALGTIHLERADLRPLLREVGRELKPLLDARQLVLDATLPAEPLLARVDPRRFQQIARNVLANAIKFAPVGSTIVVVAQQDADHGGGAHLSARDHGPGIPPAELELIFEPFVQSSVTKDGAGGTGLGLAICRQLLTAHGGTISAENMVDGGSRFHIRLPALRSACPTQPAALGN